MTVLLWVILIIIALLVVVALHDVIQKKHAILRNFHPSLVDPSLIEIRLEANHMSPVRHIYKYDPQWWRPLPVPGPAA